MWSEDTRLEVKAKGTKKNPRLRPRTEILEATDQGHKCKCFPKKKGLKKSFSVDLQKKKKKNGLEKHFSADLQNFNHSKNSAVLEPKTGQFSRTWGFEAKDLKMCPRGRPRGQGRPRGLHLWEYVRPGAQEHPGRADLLFYFNRYLCFNVIT